MLSVSENKIHHQLGDMGQFYLLFLFLVKQLLHLVLVKIEILWLHPANLVRFL